MAFLKEKLKEASSRKSDEPAGSALEPPEKFTPMCAQIHTLFNSLPRYNWEQISDIPFQNGIYIVFENGERYHGMNRIVRVGTHRSEGRLKQRMPCRSRAMIFATCARVAFAAGAKLPSL